MCVCQDKPDFRGKEMNEGSYYFTIRDVYFYICCRIDCLIYKRQEKSLKSVGKCQTTAPTPSCGSEVNDQYWFIAVRITGEKLNPPLDPDWDKGRIWNSPIWNRVKLVSKFYLKLWSWSDSDRRRPGSEFSQNDIAKCQMKLAESRGAPNLKCSGPHKV